MARSTLEQQELWERFHRVVTMTSTELRSWLVSSASQEGTPGPPGPPPLGLSVLDVLGKRRTDLTDDDLEVMSAVIQVVEEETEGLSAEAIANDERRRRRLLNVGHDPLRTG